MTLDDEPTGMGASTVDFVAQGIVDLGHWVEALEVDAGNREEMFSEWEVLDDARVALTGVCHDLEAKIAGSMSPGQKVKLGEHTFQKTIERRYVKWQSDDLLRAVLDSRLVNEATGEIVDESPVDKVARVYSLGGSSARLTALRTRGIDPDEFANAEWGRTKLRDVT